MQSLDEGAVLIGGHAFEIVSEVDRQLEVLRVALLQTADERREQAESTRRLLRRLSSGGSLLDANKAKPWLVKLLCILAERRVQAGEVERAIASIAAEQIAAGVTSGTEIVILRGLLSGC